MRKLDPDKALVLFSGGQDSAIALALALERFSRVETVGFDYGQRHRVELEARAAFRRRAVATVARWQDRLGEDHLVDLTGLKDLGESAMTHETALAIADDGLPTTFVPGRNLAFLVFAGALAYRRDAGVLVGGMCEADFSGYPDCRADALAAQAEALRLGMDADLRIEAPLMTLSKAQSWSLAEEIGGRALVDLIVEETHTCYLGARGRRHDWGYGCGACFACELRAKGWRDYAAARGGG
jgi:7-cyano-7-deazaguanine synthase